MSMRRENQNRGLEFDIHTERASLANQDSENSDWPALGRAGPPRRHIVDFNGGGDI